MTRRVGVMDVNVDVGVCSSLLCLVRVVVIVGSLSLSLGGGRWGMWRVVWNVECGDSSKVCVCASVGVPVPDIVNLVERPEVTEQK